MLSLRLASFRAGNTGVRNEIVGTLGSQTAWMLDGSGVQITSGEELAAIVLDARGGGVPGRGARDRRPREPRGARRVRAHARGVAPARPAAAHRARAAAGAGGPTALRRARRRGVGAVLARAVRPRPRRPPLGGEDRRRVRVPLAAGTRARSSRTAPTRRSRSSTRSRASARACGGRSTTGSRGIPSEALTVQQAFEATCVTPAWLTGEERRRGKLLPGFAADLVVLDRDPWDDLDAQVVATMVAGGGCTTRRRGTEPRPAVRADGTLGLRRRPDMSGVAERGARSSFPHPGWGSLPASLWERRYRPTPATVCQLRNDSSTAVRTTAVARAAAPDRRASERGERAVELARGGDPERDVLGDQPLVRRVHAASRAAPKPVMIVGMPLPASAGHDRQRAARADQRRPARRARARTRRGRAGSPCASGGTRPGGDDDQQLDLELGARRRRLAQQPLDARARSRRRVWPGREADREVRDRLDRQHGLLQVRRARPRCRSRRAPARRTCGRRTPRPPAGRPAARPARPARRRPAAARASRRAPPRSAATIPRAQRLGEAPVARRSGRTSVVISACAAFSAAPP